VPDDGRRERGLDEIVRPGPSLARVGETGGSRARRAGRFRRVGNRHRALGRAAGAIAKKHAPFGAVALRIFCAPRVTRAALFHDAERDAAASRAPSATPRAIARVRPTQTRPAFATRAHGSARANGPVRDTNATRGSVRDRGGHAARAERGGVHHELVSPSVETRETGVPASCWTARESVRSPVRGERLGFVATDATARKAEKRFRSGRTGQIFYLEVRTTRAKRRLVSPIDQPEFREETSRRCSVARPSNRDKWRAGESHRC
jgi:hypothetical protein